MEISVRQFIQNYEKGKYDDPSVDTMIDAGWYDWFCEDCELKPWLDAMFPKVKQISQSPKIDIDKMFIFFKNNSPSQGDLYDNFRFCEIGTGDVVYTVTPASGRKMDKGIAEVWGKENTFDEALVKGKWKDIEEFFATGTYA
jgi:hypothetical protein